MSVLAICAWGLLALLSLVPGRDRPHTGFSGNYEHMLAYFLAAGITRVAFPRLHAGYQLLIFSLAAAVFEICQIWIPGRSAGVDNWLASSFGALVGLALAGALMRFYVSEGDSTAAN